MEEESEAFWGIIPATPSNAVTNFALLPPMPAVPGGQRQQHPRHRGVQMGLHRFYEKPVRGHHILRPHGQRERHI